jgi:hypothetical protein
MTSNFGSSSSSVSRPIHGVVSSVSSGTIYSYSLILYKYQVLYDRVVAELIPYLKYFSKGQFEELTAKFTKVEYNRIVLSASPNNFTVDALTASYDNFITDTAYNDQQFDNYVSSTFMVLDSLWKTIPFSNDLINLKLENINLTDKYKKVLEDPIQLQHYINERNIHIMPFQASETFNTAIIINPWFVSYLQKYGPPADGYFRSDYLAEIVRELIANGSITESQFIDS